MKLSSILVFVLLLLTGPAAADFPCDAAIDPRLKTILTQYHSSDLQKAFSSYVKDEKSTSDYNSNDSGLDAAFYVKGVPVKVGGSSRTEQLSTFRSNFEERYSSSMSSTDVMYTMKEFMPEANIEAWLRCIQKHPSSSSTGFTTSLERRPDGALLSFQWKESVPGSIPPTIKTVLLSGGESKEIDDLRFPMTLTEHETYVFKIDLAPTDELVVDIASTYGLKTEELQGEIPPKPPSEVLRHKSWVVRHNEISGSGEPLRHRSASTANFFEFCPIFDIVGDINQVEKIEFFRNGSRLGSYNSGDLSLLVEVQGAAARKPFPLHYNGKSLIGLSTPYEIIPWTHPNHVPTPGELPWMIGTLEENKKKWVHVLAIAEQNSKYDIVTHFRNGTKVFQELPNLSEYGWNFAIPYWGHEFDANFGKYRNGYTNL